MVIILTLNSFAAIVSDNDGAAFITKAEFDSLKNNFQSQINSYNNSIDNKIDGAIASYLAGINVSKTTELHCICYDSAGVLSVRGKDDLNFKAGIMDIDVDVCIIRLNTTTSTVWYNFSGGVIEYNWCNSSNASDFQEVLVKSCTDYSDSIKRTAEWVGLGSTTQSFKSRNIDSAGTYFRDQYYNNNQISVGFYPYYYHLIAAEESLSDITDLTTGGNGNNPFWWNMGTSAGDMPNWAPIQINNQTLLQKNLNSLRAENIIITTNSVPYNAFSKSDKLNDLMNYKFHSDAEFTTYSPNDWMARSYMTLPILRLALIKQPSIQYNKFDYRSPTFVREARSSDASFLLPLAHFGFVRGLTNYNQIYTTKYDTYTSKIQEIYAYDGWLTDSSNNPHLPVNAGIPLVETPGVGELVLPINFEDTTKDYDVWFKWGPFDYDKDPAYDQCIDGISGAQSSDLTHAVRINNGSARLRLTVNDTSNNILFMKWSLAGNNGVGGGTFLPTETLAFVSE